MNMTLRKSVALVALLNLSYFVVEFLFSHLFDSLSLLSDSLDFLEDASINLLILIAFSWSLLARRRLSYLLAGILLIPGIVFIFQAITQFQTPQVPNGVGMSVVGLGALFVNLYCALILTRHRNEKDGLAKAAYLSARNDAFANLLIIGAGFITQYWESTYPDLIIGFIIFAMNFDAAKQVIKSQR